MLFPTITFALFFMIVLPVSWLLLPRRRRWKVFMIAASYVFYGYWDWRFCLLLGASTLANQLFARLIHRSDDERARRRWLVAAIVVNLGVLGFFKYYDFFVTSATNTLHDLGIGVSPELVSVVLPIGSSRARSSGRRSSCPSSRLATTRDTSTRAGPSS
jgi:alginate O-acetyltransferase complex protein AlgI